MGRYGLLDALRGLAVFCMIIYHALWDLKMLFSFDLPWLFETEGFLLQQFICWTFIWVSGFALALSSNKRKALRRGAALFMLGLLITAVTYFLVPEGIIIFGVLTFLGSAMMMTALLQKIPVHVPPAAGFFFSALFFFLCRGINDGILGVSHLVIARLSTSLYKMGPVGTFLGFTERGFYSADYFSLLPWIFLFWNGFFACRLLKKEEVLPEVFRSGVPLFSWLGRHSLLIYLLHQPLLFAVFSLIF